MVIYKGYKIVRANKQWRCPQLYLYADDLAVLKLEIEAALEFIAYTKTRPSDTESAVSLLV
jgi:hypothetical protein